MVYSVLPRNGEESVIELLSSDPDSLRGGPSHGYTTSCVVKNNSIGAVVFKLRARTDRKTDPNTLPSHSSPGARVKRD